MTIIELRNVIINRLQQAAVKAGLHQDMLLELEGVRAGTNPKDVIGVRWDQMLSQRWDNVDEQVLVHHMAGLA